MSTLGACIAFELMVSGSFWQLQDGANGYEGLVGNELVTQVAAGRCFELIDHLSINGLKAKNSSRIEVRLLEDGYRCWFDFNEIVGNALSCAPSKPNLLSDIQIQQRLPLILRWLEDAAAKPNKYLWGGTLGPDFDCSGLVQTAFASEKIWLPRDAYQQEQFCEKIEVTPENFLGLIPGDLLFFGTSQVCNHVAIYRGGGNYWHSSGLTYGRNGIGCDGLHVMDKNPVACHYRAQLRGAGRVVRCHDGTSLP